MFTQILKYTRTIFLLILFFGSGMNRLCLHADDNIENNRWNVLLITIDTLRADKLSCYGNKQVKTPHIDELAREGVLFSRAFAHNPLTLPSHANILLGTTPPYHGVHDNMNFAIRDDFITLAEHLKNSGYRTGAVIGAFPLDSRFGLDQGFDFYEDDFKKRGTHKNAPGERKAEVVTQIARTWLDQQASPWFLWLHVWDPHFPYASPEPYLTQYKNKPYNGEVAYVDFVMGSFFQYMKEKNLSEKTIIIFTSDHGESLGDHGEKTHGMFAYNSTIWVPLIFKIPGVKSGKNNHHVSHIDIFPTVCDLVGIEKPAILQGISLLPAMHGKKLPVRKIYFESLEPYYNFGWAPLRGFIHQKDKFIDSPILEFYNLESDFKESRNLAEDLAMERYRTELNRIIAGLSHPDSQDARTEYDYKTLEKLRSLGYVGTAAPQHKEKFTREDDIKTLLPLLNQCFNAYGYLQDGDIDKGIEQLQKMIRRKSRIYQPYVYLAKLFHAAERTSEALPVLEEGMRRFPSNYEIVRYYAEYLLESAQYIRIIDILTSKDILGMEQDPVIWNFLGRAYYETGSFEDAIQNFEKAVSIDKEFSDGFSNLGAALISLSSQTEDDRIYFKAIDNLKQAIVLDPKHEEAHFNLGYAYFQAGDYMESIPYFENSLRLGWKYGKTYFYLGIAYLGQGGRQQAYIYFNDHKDKYFSLLSAEEKRDLELYLRRSQPKKKLP